MSMIYPTAPDTNALADAIVTYLANATYLDGVTKVYTFAQKGEAKDLTDLLPISEVYGNEDDSQRHGFGGVVHDSQSFYVLSVVDMTNGASAEKQISQIRDAVVPIFVKHAQLGGAGPNTILAKYKQGSGRFIRVYRNGQWYRAHTFEILVESQWAILGGFQQ